VELEHYCYFLVDLSIEEFQVVFQDFVEKLHLIGHKQPHLNVRKVVSRAKVAIRTNLHINVLAWVQLNQKLVILINPRHLKTSSRANIATIIIIRFQAEIFSKFANGRFAMQFAQAALRQCRRATYCWPQCISMHCVSGSAQNITNALRAAAASTARERSLAPPATLTMHAVLLIQILVNFK